MSRLKIAVIGSWHQSAVLAAGFAELGHEVVGIADQPALAGLESGRAPVYEPGLDELLKQGIDSGRLHFTESTAEGTRGADFAFISIDTPVLDHDDSDLGPIWRAVDELERGAPPELIVVVTSQVPLGTSEEIGRRLQREVAYVPEFLRLGTALETFREADRFVIGADDPTVADRVESIYTPFNRPIHRTSIRSAEMAKHASNAFLATSISFINQIADLCEAEAADVMEVAAILKLDRRIGRQAFLSAGLGFAGGTLGREIRALQKLGAADGVSTELLDAVANVNDRRVGHILEGLKSAVTNLRAAPIAVFGLTYKAGTSTLRRSASLRLIEQLVAARVTVSAFDPLAQIDESANLPPFQLHREPSPALTGAQAVVLMAAWPDALGFEQAAALMARPVLMDTGNYVEPQAARAAGFEYHGVGR